VLQVGPGAIETHLQQGAQKEAAKDRDRHEQGQPAPADEQQVVDGGQEENVEEGEAAKGGDVPSEFLDPGMPRYPCRSCAAARCVAPLRQKTGLRQKAGKNAKNCGITRGTREIAPEGAAEIVRPGLKCEMPGRRLVQRCGHRCGYADGQYAAQVKH
jgi:hypothetical protein